MNNNELMNAALFYAKYGFSVFPCWPTNKHPHTLNGHNDATTDETTIRRWWKRWPDAMIGIATGNMSRGLTVFDFDEDAEKGKHGLDVLREFEAENGPFPDTVRVLTPRGGLHIWLIDPECRISCKENLYNGVDIRANGGYVIAPPSVRADGRRYEFECGYEFNGEDE